MSCRSSSEIVSDDASDFRIYGYVQDDYPGCGSCPTCCADNDYDSVKIDAAYQRAQKWYEDNRQRYICRWVNQVGASGEFSFRSSSLSQAEEVAQSSVYDWVTLQVREQAREE